jgi:dipeptidase
MCDTVVVVGQDRVLFAKNSDRDPNEAQLLEWRPRLEHCPGSTLGCTWIEIPQVELTHAVLLSRPFWMWGAEMAANEHGVVVGNEAVFTNQPYRKIGLTGMDLVRLAVERGGSARGAVDVILRLLEKHGQGGGCGHERRAFTYHNSFIAADPGEAFVVETADRHWTVQRVEGAYTISNGLTVPDFARRYSDRLKTWASRCRVRRRLTAARAAGVRGVTDLMELLRDHGEGGVGPSYDWLTGGISAPCVHPGGLAVNSQTTASWVAELRPDRASHWVTGTSAPCTGLFKPVRVTEPLDLGPPPTDRADDASLWWRHERLHRMVMRDPPRLLPLFAARRDELERAWIDDPPNPAEAFRRGDELLEEWTATVAALNAPDIRPLRLRGYWRRRDHLSGVTYNNIRM